MDALRIPENIIRPDFLLQWEEIEKYMNHISTLLEVRVDSSNMEEISGVLEEISSWHSKSTDIQASCKFYKDVAYMMEYEKITQHLKKIEFTGAVKSVTTPSVLKEYINSRVAFYNSFYERSERLARSLTHRIDALRSLLSKEKEVLRTTYNN